MTEERKIEIQKILKKEGEDLEKLLKKVTKAELVEVLKEFSECIELQKNNIMSYNVDLVKSQKIISELKENISSLDIKNTNIKHDLNDIKSMYNSEIKMNTGLLIENGSLSKQLDYWKIATIVSIVALLISILF